jgi:hypothetical protein
MYNYADVSSERQLSYRSHAPSPGGPPPYNHSNTSRHQAQSTPNGSYVERSFNNQGLNTTWERLKADVDLSPAHDPNASRNTSTGYSRLQSPSPERIYANVSRREDPPKDSQSVTHDDIQQSVLSYRERWQRSRRDRESLRLNRSASEPNRGSKENINSNNAQEIRSRSYDFADQQRNRSLLSQNLSHNYSIDRFGNKSLLNSTFIDGSAGNGSLRRDPVTHRKIPTNQQNGTLRRDSNFNLSKSRRSLARSHSTLSRTSRKVTLYGSDYKVHNSLVSLVFLSILSLVLAFLGLQLLLRLGAREASGLVTRDSILQTNDSYDNVRAVAVTFSSAVLTFNLCCVLACALQCFFAAKLIKCPHGEERSVHDLSLNT